MFWGSISFPSVAQTHRKISTGLEEQKSKPDRPWWQETAHILQRPCALSGAVRREGSERDRKETVEPGKAHQPQAEHIGKGEPAQPSPVPQQASRWRHWKAARGAGHFCSLKGTGEDASESTRGKAGGVLITLATNMLLIASCKCSAMMLHPQILHPQILVAWWRPKTDWSTSSSVVH